jgi:transposase InsO family protein
MSILMTRMSSPGSVEVAAFGGVPHGGAVEGAKEQLILGAHTSAYRTSVRGGYYGHLDRQPAHGEARRHYRATIGDGNALAVEVNLFRHTYNTFRPHQALDERTLRAAYLAVEHCD